MMLDLVMFISDHWQIIGPAMAVILTVCAFRVFWELTDSVFGEDDQ